MLFGAKDLDICLVLDCTKSVTMPDIVVVVDNDISVHCSFSESGPIVGNFHRALVSRLSSGHRCFFGDFSNFCLNCFLQDFMFIMFFDGFLNCVLFRVSVVMFM